MAKPDDSIEVWKAIPTWEGLYEVSNLGRVRRLSKQRPSRLRKLKINHNGYYVVALWNSGRIEHRFVHRLVAIAFIGSPPPDHEINHKNCQKTDNRPSNLEWVTRQENIKHAGRNGLIRKGFKKLPHQINRGESHYKAILTESDIPVILGLIEDGWKIKDIAAKYGVLNTTICNIRYGRSWNHITHIRGPES